jgi:monoamine oxidase
MIYHTTIEQQLAQIEIADQGKMRKKVLILGAGMAGLSAAYELTQRGHEVKIIEASGRLGGRVWTHHFENGQHGEFGAMRIPAAHDYTRYYIDKFKLKLRSFINSDLKNTYRDFEGVVCRAEEAGKKIGDLFSLSTSDRSKINGKNDLDEVYIDIMNIVLSSLDDSDKMQLFSVGSLSAKLKHLDQSLLKTLHNYADTYDAVRLVGKATVLDDFWHCSVITFIREEIEAAFSGLEEIEGGMDCLPNALADAYLPNGQQLRDLITFRTEVLAIEHGSEEVTVTCKQDGKSEQLSAPYILCTIPFSVLRRIRIKGLSNDQKIQDAIQGLSYHSSTKVLLNCTERFWEQDQCHGIYGGVSLTDSISRMTFYPSDNHSERDPQISKGPGVLLGSYTWGATARRLGLLGLQERGDLVLDQVERFHPQIRDYMDYSEPYASMVWDQYPFAAGAFATPKPYDLQMFFPAASQPLGRLFFAGEHLSPYPTWIQGGLWSALHAVQQIVSD